MRILEIGAGSSNLIGRVLERLGDAFASYTFTDVSADVSKKANSISQRTDDHSAVIYKKLDFERTVIEQGFQSNSYDLIISAGLLAKVKSLDNAFIGVEAAASKTTFSFEDTVSQALTPKIELYRRHLDVNELPIKIERLFIVGGETSAVRTLIRGIKPMLVSYTKTLEIYEILDEVDTIGGAVQATVLLLSDLDEPICKGCSTDKLEGFRQIVFGAHHIVCVTSGCRSQDLYANMSSGFGRTIAMEYSHLRLYLVDLDLNIKPDALEIAEILLRWHIAVQPRFSHYAHVNNGDASTTDSVITLSTLSALRTTDGRSFCLLASHSVITKKKYLALSGPLASLATIATTNAIEVDELIYDGLFAAIAAYITAETIHNSIPRNCHQGRGRV
nr:pks-nrps hybrid synthetase [Quercus suber]